ncbi:MAG: hypothetical protein ACREMA_19020 [Longimicrobiales bacterium]
MPLNDRLDRIFEIGFDYVLGVNSDELGIERVRIFALARSGFKACAN